MVAVPWVRLDCNIYDHDKTLAALGMKNGAAAMATYMFSLAWAGGHGSDGFIPKAALPIIAGTSRTALVLIESGLWEYAEGGYKIVNYMHRQEAKVVRELKRQQSALGGRKAMCRKHHGPDCNCWETGETA